MTAATPAFDANHFADQLPKTTLSLSHLVPKTQVLCCISILLELAVRFALSVESWFSDLKASCLSVSNPAIYRLAAQIFVPSGVQ